MTDAYTARNCDAVKKLRPKEPCTSNENLASHLVGMELSFAWYLPGQSADGNLWTFKGALLAFGQKSYVNCDIFMVDVERHAVEVAQQLDLNGKPVTQDGLTHMTEKELVSLAQLVCWR